MPPEILPPPWKPMNANVLSKGGERELYAYRAVLEQFDVVDSPRYAPKHGKTYCNIYVWDCTRAMGCEIPHWVTEDGNPGQPKPPSKELSVNSLVEWLAKHGHRWGWIETTSWGAHSASSRGEPVIAIAENEKGHGHVAMVMPGPNGTLHIAQAGRICLYDVPLASGFGKVFPTFYRHL